MACLLTSKNAQHAVSDLTNYTHTTSVVRESFKLSKKQNATYQLVLRIGVCSLVQRIVDWTRRHTNQDLLKCALSFSVKALVTARRARIKV